MALTVIRFFLSWLTYLIISATLPIIIYVTAFFYCPLVLPWIEAIAGTVVQLGLFFVHLMPLSREDNIRLQEIFDFVDFVQKTKFLIIGLVAQSVAIPIQKAIAGSGEKLQMRLPG